MAQQNGYSFTPGKYNVTEQTDVVSEQEKSNQRILDSENQFLDDMNARDDALVEKTRSEFESIVSLTEKGANWLTKKAEKDKKDKLQAGAALAIKIPASEEDIAALVAQEDGLHNSHLKISEIADRIEEETGSFELAERFRNLSGWEQYAYVKASLTRAAGGYQDFKDARRDSVFLTDKETNQQIFYKDADENQRRGLDAKIRHEFSEQFIGVNEKLLAATVAPEVKKVDEAEIAEAKKERDELKKADKKNRELNSITDIITSDSAQSLKDVDKWINRNAGTYKSTSTARLVFRDRVVDLVKSGKLSYFEAKGLLTQKFYHEGDKKEVTLEKFKEFNGFLDEITKANTEYRKNKLDDDKYEVESQAEAVKNELEKSGTELSLEQKQSYLKKRRKDFPNVALNEMEQGFLYGYRDDDAMRQDLEQIYESTGNLTEANLKQASPKLRKEIRDKGWIQADVGQQITNLSQVSTENKKRVEDLVANAAKSTGALEAKPVTYYALLDATEDEYIKAYNSATVAGFSPADAHDQAYKYIQTVHGTDGWIDENSVHKGPTGVDEYQGKVVRAMQQIDPENKGYTMRLLEAPKAQKDELKLWAANGGTGQVPYFYRHICKGTNILPRELAWRQAGILGYEGQFDEKEALKEFKVPKYMVTLFLNNSPTKNGAKRFAYDVETIENEPNEEEVHPYEENEDFE